MSVVFERRRYPRQRTLLGGRFVFNGWSSTIDCQIRNLTPAGARISLSGTAPLPGHFELLFLAKNQSKQAKVVWSRTNEAGIAFTATKQMAATGGEEKVLSLETAREIRKLKEERDELRQRVARLTEEL